MNNKFLSAIFMAMIAIAITTFLLNKKSEPVAVTEKAGVVIKEQPLNNPSQNIALLPSASLPSALLPSASLPSALADGKKEIELREQEDEEQENDGPDLAQEQEFNRTKNPALGRPTPENLPIILQEMKTSASLLGTPGSNPVPWMERGPKNVGGRTRAIMIDPNDATKKTIWSAGVDGGLWKTTDITAASPNWTANNDFLANMAITCMAYDSTNNDTMYFGTGEVWYNEDAVKGFGVWRTTDKGVNWTQLSSTAGVNFTYINKIVVHPTNHKVYLATHEGIFLSTNAGNTFTPIGYDYPTAKNIADIELSSTGRVHIGIGGGGSFRDYHYTDDDGTNWDPTTSNFDTVVTGGFSGGYRVELAMAPNNSSVLYALVGTTGPILGIYKSTNSGVTWAATSNASWVDQNCGAPTADFTRGQAWYDLAIAVNPNNADHVIIGGVDLLKTTNGGTSWTQISSWCGACSRQNVHADQHIVLYEPGNTNVAYFGNDGGIYRTANATAATPTITSKNTNYNVTQFYSCALHPTSGSNIILAGSQDNGTQRFKTPGINATTEVNGGDGGYCFIDQTNPKYQISSYYYNNYSLSVDTGVTFTSNLISNNTGLFINPADYDNNQHILYSCKDNYTLWRVKNITTTPSSPQSISITGMTDYASHIRVSPYTTSSSTLFVGTVVGSLFKVTNADNTPTITNISGAGFPAYCSISCVEIGASENELLVTFFNYGVNSVWYTSDGGTTWVSKEGNLPDMPIRWALFNPSNHNEVLLATELGVWATTNLSASAPTWIPSNSGLANVRVDMMQLRDADTMIIAATHGRGLFSSEGFSAAPVPAFTASLFEPCINQTVTFTDTSALNPTSWYWSITPSTYSFVASTTANSQNPKVQFTAPGESYSITLNATNSFGFNELTKTNYITTPIITNNTISGTQAGCSGFAPSTFTGTVPAGGAGAVATGLKINEEFNGVLVPAGWNLLLNQGSMLSADNTKNSYGRSGTLGVIKANNYYVSADSVVRLNTKTFAATKAKELLRFDIAHAAWYPGYTDSLTIYTSSGSGFNRLIGWCSAQVIDTIDGITTSDPVLGSPFVPTAAQWTAKAISLPVGTVQIRFEFRSGNANQLYIDRVRLDSFAYPIAYLWQKSTTSSTLGFSAAGGTNTTQNYTSASLSQSSWFRRVITSGACTSDTSSTIAITVYALPTATATPTGSATFCQGGSVTINANTGSGLTYIWRKNGSVITGATASSYVAGASGNYKVVVTNSNNCIDSSSAVTVTINALPTATATAAGPTTFCQGGNVTINANTGSGLSYQWRKNGADISAATSSNFIATASGNYKVFVTNSNNCIDSSNAVSVTVNTLSTATATAATATTFCQGGNVTINANTGSGLSYQWRKNGADISTATSSSYVATTSGNYKVVVTNSNSCVDSSTAVSVTVNALPTATANTTGSTTFCQGGSVTINANTGSGLSYQWRKNGTDISTATNSSFVATTSGNYKVVVTNSNNCSDSSTAVSVTVNSLPAATATATGATTFCQGGSVTINANTGSGLSYQWRKNGANISAATSLNYAATTTGNYKVVVTNSNNCSDSSGAVSVTVNTLPTATATASGSTTFCQGGSVTINANTGIGLSYEWRNNGLTIGGASSSGYTATTSGNYKVAVTNANGCVDSSGAVSVTVNPLPTATATAAGSTTFCTGGNVTINANTGAGLSYQWRNNGTDITGAIGPGFVATTSGNYKVVVTNLNGCTDSSGAISVTVNSLPVATATAIGSTTFCPGGSVNINANTGIGLNYQWTNNGAIIGGANSSSYNATTGGSYKVVVTNSNGCEDSSSAVSVTVLPLPTATATAASATSFCPGGSVTINANTGNGLIYQWRKNGAAIGGATDSSYIATTTGNYKVVVTNSNGCSDSSTAVNVIVNPLPVATASAAGATTFCAGGSVTINANTGAGLSYEWRNNNAIISGSSGTSYIATTAGNYKVVVSNANGCKDSSQAVVVTINPLPASPVITRSNFKLSTVDVAVGYQWYRNDTAVVNAIQMNYDITSNGVHKLKITDINGCVAYSNSMTIGNVGIGINKVNNDFKIYPNPASDKLMVKAYRLTEENARYEIINTIGQVILTGELKENETEINISSLAVGVYKIKVGDKVQKFVKE